MAAKKKIDWGQAVTNSGITAVTAGGAKLLHEKVLIGKVPDWATGLGMVAAGTLAPVFMGDPKKPGAVEAAGAGVAAAGGIILADYAMSMMGGESPPIQGIGSADTMLVEDAEYEFVSDSMDEPGVSGGSDPEIGFS